jgi:hypothetical protein
MCHTTGSTLVFSYEVEQQDEQRGRKTGKSDIHGVIVSLE